MLVYWLLLALPALMAIAYPVQAQGQVRRLGQEYGFVAFLLVYTLLGALRYQTGGDWANYELMYDDIRLDSLGYSLTATDPLFGILAWIDGQIGAQLMLTYGVCCFLLCLGVVRVARRFDEPWLALTIAVPYLLIVVGFGYVRQAAAIGLVLIAVDSLGRANVLRTGLYLLGAMLFHSSAIVTVPLFAFSIAGRHKLLALAVSLVGIAGFLLIFAPRLETFQSGYIDADFESTGAATRVAMGAMPAAFVLLFWKRFAPALETRNLWLLVALANMALVAALVITSASTAVDRIALFFSVIQMAAFGEFRRMIGAGPRSALVLRLVLIAVVAVVQAVWLLLADNSNFWIPYRWIFGQA